MRNLPPPPMLSEAEKHPLYFNKQARDRVFSYLERSHPLLMVQYLDKARVELTPESSRAQERRHEAARSFSAAEKARIEKEFREQADRLAAAVLVDIGAGKWEKRDARERKEREVREKKERKEREKEEKRARKEDGKKEVTEKEMLEVEKGEMDDGREMKKKERGLFGLWRGGWPWTKEPEAAEESEKLLSQ
ncbi:hypothetical protein N431DRAFT_482310 [Stipitochalara longipes BDJ]|nr:hypothetical protein N431DRAFT_482310 [Stipitochalara longipes BDJ]